MKNCHTQNTKKQTKKRHKFFKRFLICFSVAFLFLFGSAFTYFVVLYNRYDLDINKLTSVNNGIRVYSATGQDNTLYNSNRSIVEIDSLPKYVLNAFVDVEDKRFYSHKGYDLKRIAKAGIVNLTSKSKSQGASTISQQLIKNALLTNEKTYKRKLKEIVLAIKLEKKFSKSQILEMYLNTIYFGQNAYGIENASRVYFGKSAKDLTLNEACCLAGLIKSPAKYSPINNYTNAVQRKNLVAKFMLNQNSITQQEYNQIVNTDLSLATEQETDFSYEREAIYEACTLLNITERELINGNYEIVTNKQDELQKQVVEANTQVLIEAKKSANQNLDSISIVADNNGKILAYFANSKYNLHNMNRQPASILKPLAVYLPCFTHNILSPATQILDEPINYNGFSPKNADGKFSGYISVRDAISESSNIPAVKALDYVGIDKAVSLLADMGINLSNADHNLALALGATKNGLKLNQIVVAYTTIANYGTYKPLCFVNKILNKNGQIVYSSQDYSEKVVDDASCFLLTDCLKQTAKTGTARRFADLGFEIASKTGTAYDGKNNTDLFNVAYTTEHTTLTWIANIKDNSLDSSLHSSCQPTEINKRIMQNLYAYHKPSSFSTPAGIEKVAYDLDEYQTNHTIITPRTSKDRFIAYDYFKTEMLPKPAQSTNNDLVASLSKNGCFLYFDAKKFNDYTILKTTQNKSIELTKISEKSGTVEFKDTDIFKCDEITYTLISNSTPVAITKIRPKDYLLGLIESQMLNGKSKWFV